MRATILISLFLAVLLTSSAAQTTCTISAPVSTFASANASCSTSAGCVLTQSLIGSIITGLGCVLTGLTGAANLVIAPTGSGNLNINIGASASSLFGNSGISSLTLNASAGVNLVGILDATATIAGDVSLFGASTLSVAQGIVVNVNGAIIAGVNSTVSVAQSAVVNVQGALSASASATVNVAQAAIVNVKTTVSVQASASLNVAGNVSAEGVATISGLVKLGGTKVETAAQTAWIRASSITVSGASAVVAGNGGFDGDVSLSLNATVNVGNSPGTVYVAGNLNMDATTTLQIEIASTTNFDRILIRGTFSRNGILYANFIGNYLPDSDSTYTFATHSGASGDFNIVHGNYFDRTATRISANYGALATSLSYNSASSASVSIVALLIPVAALLFAAM